ncbi:MAG: hypothetical protein ABW047_16945 [Nitrospiraceae bacterium]
MAKKVGAARPSFNARIEGAHSDRAASVSKKDSPAAPPGESLASYGEILGASSFDTSAIYWKGWEEIG